METGKRLIPYSVHLTESVYTALKSAAKERKASALVRDAITMIIEGDTAYNSGYNKGIRDCVNLINAEAVATAISFNNVTIADTLINQLVDLHPATK